MISSQENKCRATGIGSTPHTDPIVAVDFAGDVPGHSVLATTAAPHISG
jgi:hypothetical protein